ncbi:MAG: glycosylasparaginase [Opitutaceae bacterium]|mgnify:CR=1 FL=1|nr:glycosylasparaginase [Opitutaceae bacterium]
MNSRRRFLSLSTLGTVSGFSTLKAFGQAKRVDGPIVLSTWNSGIPANNRAFQVLQEGGSVLDCVEKGVNVIESDPNNRTVGIGGFPDEEGHVTLDACIMDERQRCGSVAFLQHIENPVSVARRIMEDTKHVMLVGEGALNFALRNGFEKKVLLTEKTLTAWKKRKAEAIASQPEINVENHDTIGLVARNADGNLAGACTTSGVAMKLHGRVGDSPIIGAGLYVDNDVGAAAATGWGEAVLENAGSAMVVELMRHGRTPQQACEEIVNRIAKKFENWRNIQVGFIALNKAGEIGAFAIQSGFSYAHHSGGKNQLIKSTSLLNNA